MLIGLHGKKQAGKDTVYERIVARFGEGSNIGADVVRVSFADKLYESAAAALGVDVDFLREWKADPRAGLLLVTPDEAENPVTRGCLSFREYLQNFGTEAHRDIFGSNFWVDNVDLSHEGRIVVVTDVRFNNEAQAVIDAGGTVVHVVGPDEVELAADGHASEVTLPERYIDATLHNKKRDDDFVSLDLRVMDLLIDLIREERACA